MIHLQGRAPRNGNRRKRPLGQIQDEKKCACPTHSSNLDDTDPCNEYIDPYKLNENEDDTCNRDAAKDGRERRMRFEKMMLDFGERVQESSRRQEMHAINADAKKEHNQEDVMQREVCDRIESRLKPIFMRHKNSIHLHTQNVHKHLCQVLMHCGAKANDLQCLLTVANAVIYIPCVSTSYVRVSIVLRIQNSCVVKFSIEDGWRREKSFVVT